MQSLILPLELFELEEDNYHLLVQSVFSDNMLGKWVIDTGASRSVFDSNLTRFYSVLKDESDEETLSAGIGIDSIETEVGEIESASFGGWEARNMKVALIDLTHINNLYAKYGGGIICGLIGSDFLRKYHAVIDYGKKELILLVT